MGMYDSQIASLRKKLDQRRDQVRTLEGDIRELEVILGKCDVINSKVSEAMGNMLHNIDKKKVSIKGNFTAYYKEQIDQIVKSNKLHDISGESSSDKSQIKSRVISCEDQIKKLCGEINLLEADLAYYQANNIESGMQVN